jgi:hypothetical protein
VKDKSIKEKYKVQGEKEIISKKAFCFESEKTSCRPFFEIYLIAGVAE